MRTNLASIIVIGLLVSCAASPNGSGGAPGGSAAGMYDAVVGRWEMTTDFRGTDIDAVMTLSVIDGGLSGSWESQGMVSELIGPALNGDRLSFGRAVGEMSLEFEGTVRGNEITGKRYAELPFWGTTNA